MIAPIHAMIVLMTEAASTSETSVNFYQTIRRNIPEHSHHLNLFSAEEAILYHKPRLAGDNATTSNRIE
jgi:hypothetical protein